MTARHSRPVLLERGAVIGSVVVVCEKSNGKGHWRWELRCGECLRHFYVGGGEVREHDKKGTGLECPFCHPKSRDHNKRPSSPTCSHCGVSGHQRASCPDRDRIHKASKYCGDCAGLPHRRMKPRCPGCGEQHQAEAPYTIADVLAAPRNCEREAI